MSEAPFTGGFEFDGFRARAETQHESDQEWLREFLCPQFAPADPSTAMCVVRFRQDPERCARLLAEPERAQERVIDVFALDQQIVRLPSWTGPDGVIRIVDEKFHSVYLLRSATEIEIVASTKRRGPRIPAMRVLREFAMNHSLTAGRLFVHGSSVALGDSGIVIAGPSGAGKTTFLMHLLSLGDTEFISNDRVLVRNEPDGIRFHGMPAIVTLRSTTLDLYPALSERLTSAPWNHYRTIREAEADGKPIRAWGDGRYGLTPAQFCRLMGVQSRASARARAVLIPRQTHEPGHITLTPLPPDEAERRLLGAIFGIGCWEHDSNVFALPGDRDVIAADELRRRCRRLADGLPVFECALGRQAYDDPAATRAILSRLDRVQSHV